LGVAIVLNMESTGDVMDDKKLLALAKKNAAKSQPKKPAASPKYDSTLPPEPEGAEDVKRFFKEMKKRDF
jgi:hypothetical protein